jgi:hypothetical protein
MKSNSRALSFLIFPAAALLLAACGSKVIVQPTAPAPSALVATPSAPPPQQQVLVTTVPAMPNPPIDTVQGPSPGDNYTWVSGYYNWSGDRYQWVPGTWVRTPVPTSVWVPGRWQPTAGGYVWIAGHWQ